MSQYQSFFINAFGDSNQCDELNQFLKSHIIVRTIENNISTGQNLGIQIVVEYKENGALSGKNSKRIDWRASLANDEQKEMFDKLKSFRASFAKEKKLVGAYMVCKDEHLAIIVQKPGITVEEIENLPHSGNILIKEYAQNIYDEFQKLKNEKNSVPF